MDIRFVSTLTSDDENQLAPVLLRAVTALLDAMPIAYTLRVETLDGRVFQHTRPPAGAQAGSSEGRTPIPMAVRRLAGA